MLPNKNHVIFCIFLVISTLTIILISFPSNDKNKEYFDNSKDNKITELVDMLKKYIEKVEKTNPTSGKSISSDQNVNSKLKKEKKCCKKLENEDRLYIDSCPSRNVIQDELMILSDNITAMDIKYKKLNTNVNNIHQELSELDNEVKEVSSSNKTQEDENAKDVNESINTRDKSSKDAKKKTISDTSDSIANMSGMSKSKASSILENHYSKKTSVNSFNDYKNSVPSISKEQLKEQHRKSASILDQKNHKPVDSKSTSNNFFNANAAKCLCSSLQKKTNSNIEKQIINEANDYGFINHYASGTYCDPDKDCAKKNASKRLKELCLKYNCEVKNPLGSYPYNMKKINDKTKKSRPKGYDFPQ